MKLHFCLHYIFSIKIFIFAYEFQFLHCSHYLKIFLVIFVTFFVPFLNIYLNWLIIITF